MLVAAAEVVTTQPGQAELAVQAVVVMVEIGIVAPPLQFKVEVTAEQTLAVVVEQDMPEVPA
jgi:hypothetical protein